VVFEVWFPWNLNMFLGCSGRPTKFTELEFEKGLGANNKETAETRGEVEAWPLKFGFLGM